MEKSLFQKGDPEKAPPTPHELISKEIDHLKKGSSVRYGKKKPSNTLAWIFILLFCGLAGLYVMDPVCHAWYKGTAARVYLYLHNYGSQPEADSLVASQILSPDEVQALNGRSGSFEGYFSSPDAAKAESQKIIDYMNSARLLHAGKYEQLDPVGKVRYVLFVKTDLLNYLPIKWSFLDPTVQ